MRRMIRANVERSFRVRVRLLAGCMAVVCFGTLTAQLFRLQLLEGEWYARKAAGQQLRDTVVPADRGEIYSANGVLLATNASCWTIRASPREIPDDKVALAAAGMADILQLDHAEVLEKFSQRSSNDCLLKYRVDKTAADAVRDFCEQNGVTGILINQDSKRYYPQGAFLASVLGFTNVDNVGVSGLELQYNSRLTGSAGLVMTAANAWGYTMQHSYAAIETPVQGDSLVLTIDTNIQHYLENALAYAVAEHNVAQRAVGIVMEVNTGRVLAMATTQAYDPNQPRVIYDETVRAAVEALNGEEKAAARTLAQQTQWRNKAVSDLYEPGSVFKLITAAAALDAGVVTPNSTFLCTDSINVAGTRFHCANHRRHGVQTLTQCLMNSCNQGFIQVGARLGKQKFYDYFKAFGLCEATGIDLPAEPKKSEHYTAERMGPVELASCSFGQSSKISYLQMLSAVCAVVNGGKLMQPYVVQQVVSPEGRVLQQTQPVLKGNPICEQTSLAMRQMMEQVVLKGGGHNAYVAGFRIGGKSGTSQKLDSEDENARIASFVAAAPIDDPQVAVLVCLDEPHSWTTAGGSLSAPVCAEVLEHTLTYLGIARQANAEENEQHALAAAAVPVQDGDSDNGL
ncbi:MAG: peptidase [Faecalibacterium sp.]|nr:peptidase [Faecalibacterium sp.]